MRPVVAAVIVADGRVLLVRRRVAEGRLSWQFPAGEMVSGETVPDTAEREVREETGVRVAARQVIGDRIHPLTGRWMFYVTCHLTGGAVPADAYPAAPDEVAQVAWCTFPELRGLIPDGIYGTVEQHLLAVLPTTTPPPGN